MDWDSIERLLNIIDKAKQWPTLRHIHDAAMRELGGIKDDRVEQLKQRAEQAEAKHAKEAQAHSKTKDQLSKVTAELATAAKQLEDQQPEPPEMETPTETAAPISLLQVGRSEEGVE
jgi:hypothetical protein